MDYPLDKVPNMNCLSPYSSKVKAKVEVDKVSTSSQFMPTQIRATF